MSPTILLAALIPLLFAGRAIADPVVIVGTFTQTSMANGNQAADRGIQVDSVCQAIQGAKALGHEVVLLTPTIRCGQQTYTGRCKGGKECQASEIEAGLKKLAGSLTPGKQNLVIQTVGHGSPDMRPSWDESRGPQNNELGIGTGNLTAAELARMIESSGLSKKVNHIRGVWTQCYSGGWNEMGRLIRPAGKFCSVSQSSHARTADVTEKEWEKFGGSGFVQGFWNTQVKSRGMATLQESTIAAAHVKKYATGDQSWSNDWTSTSRYLLEKKTKTGDWYVPKSDEDYADKRPRAYFPEGYNVDDLPAFQAFTDGVKKVAGEADKIRERDQKRVEEIRDYNAEKWFFQDERRMPSPALMRNKVCVQNVRGPVTGSVQKLMQSMGQIRTYAALPGLEAYRPKIERMLAQWKADHDAAAKGFPAEVKRYHERNNALLLRSGALMRKINSGKLSYSERKKAEDEYQALGTEFFELGRLQGYPSLRAMLAAEKSVTHLENLLALLSEKRLDPETKQDILAMWDCENTPVFVGGKK